MPKSEGKPMTLYVAAAREVQRSKDENKKWIKYLFDAADDRGNVHRVSYFYYPDSPCPVDKKGNLKEDFYLQGTVSGSKWGDTFDRGAIQVEGFSGTPVVPTPFDDDPPDPRVYKDYYFEAFGHIHSAAPIVAKLIKATEGNQVIRERLVEIALVCRDAHKELTEKLIEEKQNGGT